MAFQKVKMNYATGISAYVADSTTDLANLPVCGMGSTVYVIDEAKTYIKNSKNKWLVKAASSSSSSGSISGDDDSISNNDIDSLLDG